jgi:acetyl esterase/lipase
MASLKSLLLKATLKTISPIIVNADIEIQRNTQDFLGSMKKKPQGIIEMAAELGQIKAEWFYLEESPKLPIILYFHGGAYVTGSLLSGRVIASELASRTGYRTLAFEYRLAPEHPFPAALIDAITMYDHLLQNGYQPSNIVFAGESAGGGLLLSTTLALKEKHFPLPAALVCISPWTDLSCSSASHVLNAASDPLLTTVYLKESALAYAGENKTQTPYMSPAFGDFTGMPPVLIQAGADEILLDDSRIVYEKLNKCNVAVSIRIWENMWHIWHMFDIPESHEAFNDIREFIRRYYVE